MPKKKLAKLSDKEFEARTRASHALSRMRRDHLSLNDAAEEEGTTPTKIKKYFPKALRRKKPGVWVATKNDRYVRAVRLPGVHGPVTVFAKSYSEAQLASAYLASLNRWARSEKAYELASFHGKKIGGFELITAARVLRPLRDAGLLQLDSLYASVKEVL